MNSSNTHDTSYPASAATPMGQLWLAIASRWAAHLERLRKVNEFHFADELSVDTLRDIGAPEHVIARAAAHRESQQQRLNEMRQWRDG